MKAVRQTPRAQDTAPTRSREWIATRNALGLLEMFSLARRWGLKNEQLSTLLGTPVRTLQRWHRQATDAPAALEIPVDTVERISYLLGISKALQILLPTADNRRHWLTQPNDDPAFNQQAPLERMLQGQVADLFHVRRYLDGARG